MSNRKLTIEVFFDTPENMEKSLNRAIMDFSRVLVTQGCVDMELTAAELDNPEQPIYNLKIADNE